MNKSLKTAVLWLSAFALVSFGIIVFNQTMQIVQAARWVNAPFGSIVLWAVIAVYAVLVLTPVWMLVRLPKPLKPPATSSGPEFDAYLQALGKRLATNPNLQGGSPRTGGEIEHALGILAQRSDEVIRDAAAGVFLTTAISQNGRLDTFLVLAAQGRMVWRVARIYYQRPTVQELIQLYAAVATTAFVAGELEDIDIEEQIEPIVGSVLGTALGGIPGLKGIMSILLGATLTGAANAFLTLRVGGIAKRYCMGLKAATKREIRRAATKEASKALGPIVGDGAKKVSSALWKVSKNKAAGVVNDMKEYARSAVGRGDTKVPSEDVSEGT